MTYRECYEKGCLALQTEKSIEKPVVTASASIDSTISAF